MEMTEDLTTCYFL